MIKIEFPEGFVEALTLLCESYDADNGEYPESCCEGEALLQYYFGLADRVKSRKQ